MFTITRENDRFVFSGRGWGHGVGFCQEGAKWMARHGKTYQEILDHPVFSRSRAPFVPPPPAPPPKPASPPVVFVDPGLVLGGVMVAESTKKAYLFQRANRDGSWVAEGEDFVGWKVQSITTDAVRLEKDSRVLEVRLYSEK